MPLQLRSEEELLGNTTGNGTKKGLTLKSEEELLPSAGTDSTYVFGKGTTSTEDPNRFDFQTKTDIDNYELAAQRQSSASKLGSGLVNAVTQTGLDIVKDASYLLDFSNVADFQKQSEVGFNNFLADAMTKTEEAIKLPVYRTKASEGFSPLSAGFWGENMPSILSTVAMAIPAEFAVAGLSKLGRGALDLAKASKTLRGTKIAESIASISGNKQVLNNLKGVTGAVLSRQMENLMEGGQTYQDTYATLEGKINPATDLPYTDDEKKQIAGEAAATNYQYNWANLATDIPQYMTLHKTFKKALGDMKFNKAEIAKNIFGESLEEGAQYVANEEAKRKALINAGALAPDKSDIVKRIGEYAQDGEFWTSVFLGGLGGGLFTAAGAFKNARSAEKQKQVFDSLTSLHTSVVKGDPSNFNRSSDEAFTNVLMNHVMQDRTGDLASALQDTTGAVDSQEDLAETKKSIAERLKVIDFADQLKNSLAADNTKPAELKAVQLDASVRFKLASQRLQTIERDLNVLRSEDAFTLNLSDFALDQFKLIKLQAEAIKDIPNLKAQYEKLAKLVESNYATILAEGNFKSKKDIDMAIASPNDAELTRLLMNKEIETTGLKNLKEVLYDLNTKEGIKRYTEIAEEAKTRRIKEAQEAAEAEERAKKKEETDKRVAENNEKLTQIKAEAQVNKVVEAEIAKQTEPIIATIPEVEVNSDTEIDTEMLSALRDTLESEDLPEITQPDMPDIDSASVQKTITANEDITTDTIKATTKSPKGLKMRQYDKTTVVNFAYLSFEYNEIKTKHSTYLETAYDENGLPIVSESDERLSSSSIKPGDTLEVRIDTDYKDYESLKNDPDKTPIGIYLTGETKPIAYVHTPEWIENNAAPDYMENILLETKAIRQAALAGPQTIVITDKSIGHLNRIENQEEKNNRGYANSVLDAFGTQNSTTPNKFGAATIVIAKSEDIAITGPSSVSDHNISNKMYPGVVYAEIPTPVPNTYFATFLKVATVANLNQTDVIIRAIQLHFEKSGTILNGHNLDTVKGLNDFINEITFVGKGVKRNAKTFDMNITEDALFFNIGATTDVGFNIDLTPGQALTKLDDVSDQLKTVLSSKYFNISKDKLTSKVPHTLYKLEGNDIVVDKTFSNYSEFLAERVLKSNVHPQILPSGERTFFHQSVIAYSLESTKQVVIPSEEKIDKASKDTTPIKEVKPSEPNKKGLYEDADETGLDDLITSSDNESEIVELERMRQIDLNSIQFDTITNSGWYYNLEDKFRFGTEKDFIEILTKGYHGNRHKTKQELIDKINTKYDADLVKLKTRLSPNFDRTDLKFYRAQDLTLEQQNDITNSIAALLLKEIEAGNNPNVAFSNVLKKFKGAYNKAITEDQNDRAAVIKLVIDNWSANDVFTGFITLSELKLAQLSTRIDGEVVQTEEGVLEKRSYEESTFETNPKDTASGRLKAFLSFVPRIDRKSILGVDAYYDFNELYNEIMTYLADTEFNDMLGELQDLSTVKPQFQIVISRLLSSDTSLQNEFFSNFKKRYSEQLQVNFELAVGGSTAYTRSSNRNSLASTILSQWEENLKASNILSQITEGENIGATKIDTKAISELHKEFKRITDLKVLSDKDLDALTIVFSKIGITIDKNALKDLQKNTYITKAIQDRIIKNSRKDLTFKDLQSLLKNKIDYIFKVLESSEEDSLFETNNPFVSEQDSLRILAGAQKKYEVQLQSASYRDALGNTIFAYNNPTYYTNQLLALKAPDNENTIDKLLSTEFASTSDFLKQLRDKTSELYRVFNIARFDATRKSRSNEPAQEFSEMSKKLRELTKLWLFQNQGSSTAYLTDITYSDKKITNVITVPKIDTSNWADPNSQAFSMLRNLAIGELMRIKQAQLQIDNLPKDQLIDKYHTDAKGGLIAFLFPGLNNSKLFEEGKRRLKQEYIDGPFLKSYLTDGIILPEIQEIIDDTILTEVTGWIATKKDILTKEGIEVGMLDKSYLYGKKNGVTAKVKDRSLVLDYAITDYVINYAITTGNMVQIMHGDIALAGKKGSHTEGYIKNTYIEYFKRMAKDIAPGIEAKPTSPITKVVYANDVKIETEAAKKFSKKLESTDAQAITTTAFHITKLFERGLIKEELYKSILSKIEKHPNDYDSHFSETEKKVFFQPRKPVYVKGNIENGINNISYLKMMDYPLLPSLTSGTNMDVIRKSMESSGAELLVFKSGVKMGSKNPVSFYNNETGEFTFDPITLSSHIVELDSSGFRIQQDNPLKEENRIIEATQQKKLLFVDLPADLMFGDRTRTELKAEYDQKHIDLVNLKWEKLLDRFDAKKLENGQYQVEDMTKFHEFIKGTAIEKGWNPNELAMLELTEDKKRFKVPLIYANSTEKIESLLSSLLTSNLARVKLPGKAYIQASSIGYEATTKNVISDPALKYMQTDKTGMYSEVAVAWPYRDLNYSDYVNEDGTPKNTIAEKLLYLIGYRIPNQGHNSMLRLKVVKFLNPQLGDLMLVPSEITMQMGSDFDVDKLNTYSYNTHVEDGKLTKYNGKDKLMNIENSIIDINHTVLSNKTVNEKVGQPLDSESLKDIAFEVDKLTSSDKQVISILNDEVSDKALADNKSGKLLTALTSLSATNHALAQEANLFIASNKNGDVSVLFKDNKGNIYNDSPEGNSIKKTTEEEPILIGQKVRGEYDGGNKNFRGEVVDYRIKRDKGMMYFDLDIKTSTGKVITEQYFGTPESPLKFDNDFHNEINKITSTSNTHFNHPFEGGWRLDKVEGFTKVPISKVISGIQSAAVDNAKEQLLGMTNLNSTTYAVADLIVRTGFDESFLVPFMKQESIMELVARVEKFNDPTEESSSRAKLDDIKNKLLSVYETLANTSINSVQGFSREEMNDLLKLSSKYKYHTQASDKEGFDFYKAQAQILYNFLQYEKVAKEITSLKASLSPESSGVGKSLTEVLYNQERIERAQTSFKYLGNTPNFFEGTAIGNTLDKAIFEGNKLYKNLYPYGESSYNSFYDQIQNELGEDVVINLELKDELNRELRSAIYSKFYEDVKAERARLLIDTFVIHKKDNAKQFTNKSVAQRLLEYNGNNRFIKKLKTEITSKSGEASYVLYFASSAEEQGEGLENSIAWQEALNSSDLTEKQLGEDLVKYAYLTGGAQSQSGFVKYVPTDYIQNKLSGDAFVNFYEESTFDNIFRQYFQHRPWRAKKLSPDLKQVMLGKDAYENNKLKPEYVPDNFDVDSDSDLSSSLLVKIKGRVALPQFLSLRTKGKWAIYESIGVNPDGTLKYQRINTLGGFNFKEYDVTEEKNTSILGSNNPVIKNVPTPIGADLKGSTIKIAEPTKSPIIQAIKDNNLTEVLEEIVKADNKYSSLAKYLSDYSAGINISEDTKQSDRKGYQTGNNLFINTSLLAQFEGEEGIHETVLHELFHALTNGKLSLYKTDKSKLTPKELEAIQSLERLLGVAKAKLGGKSAKYNYALNSLDEFISYALTDKELQADLNVIPFAGSQSILDRIFELIGKLLGIEVVRGSVLGEAVNNVLNILDKESETETVRLSPLFNIDKLRNIAKRYIMNASGYFSNQIQANNLRKELRDSGFEDVIVKEKSTKDGYYLSKNGRFINPFSINFSPLFTKKEAKTTGDVGLDKVLNRWENQLRILKQQQTKNPEQNAEKQRDIDEVEKKIEELLDKKELGLVLERAKIQLKQVDALLAKPEQTAESLSKALAYIAGWEDINKIFSFQSGTDEAKTIGDIVITASTLRNKWSEAAKAYLVALGKSEGLDFSKKEYFEGNFDTTLATSLWFDSSISEVPLEILLDRIYKRTIFKANEEISAKHKEIEEKVKPIKKKFDKLVQTREDGSLTGNLISQYKQEYYDKIKELLAVAKAEPRKWKEYWSWIKENSYTLSTADTLKGESDKFTKEELNKAKELLDQYEKDLAKFKEEEAEKLSYSDTYINKDTDELIQLDYERNLADNIADWEREHSPYARERVEKEVNAGTKKAVELRGMRGDKYMLYPKPKENWRDSKYDEMIKDKELSDFYNYFKDTVEEYLDHLPNVNDVQSNTIPELRQTLKEKYITDGFSGALKGVGNKFIEAITTDDLSDKEYGVIDEETGKPVRILRAGMLANKLTPEEKSYNLERVLKEFVSIGASVKFKSQVESQLQLGEKMLFEVTENLKGVNGPKLDWQNKTITLSNGMDNTRKRVAYLMDTFYGMRKDIDLKDKKAYESGPLKGKVVASSKVVDAINQYTVAKGLALNPFSGAVNLFFANISNRIEAAGGQSFSDKDLNKAEAMMYGSMFERSKEGTKRKIAMLMDKLQVMGDVNQANYGEKSVYDWTFFMQHMGEYVAQGNSMLAVLSKEGILNKIKIVDGELVFPEGTDLFKLSGKIQQINKYLHGNYQINSPTLIKKQAWGRMLMVFRNWIPYSMKNRFGKKFKDETLGYERKGRYITYRDLGFKDSIATLFKLSLAGRLTGQKVEDISEVDLANMKQNLRELSYMASFYVVTMMLKGMAEGLSDDEDEILNYALNTAIRTEADLWFFVSPKAFNQIVKDPIPPLKTANDFLNVITSTGGFIIGDDEIKAGRNKGDSNLGRSLKKAFPITTQIVKLEAATQQVFGENPK